jgi:hypothetical protein
VYRDRPAAGGGTVYDEGPGRRERSAGYREAGGAYPGGPRRAPAPPSGKRKAAIYDVDDDDERDDEPEPGGYLASAAYTAMWYAVPMVLWVLWSLTLNSEASANCVDDAGVPCASERAEAITTLIDSLPQVGATMLFSVLVAMVLRWVSGSWRAGTVGFAAAVVGGGLATVAISVITGQPIG